MTHPNPKPRSETAKTPVARIAAASREFIMRAMEPNPDVPDYADFEEGLRRSIEARIARAWVDEEGGHEDREDAAIWIPADARDLTARMNPKAVLPSFLEFQAHLDPFVAREVLLARIERAADFHRVQQLERELDSVNRQIAKRGLDHIT